MSNIATEQMLAAVRSTKESAKRAEQEYDRRADRLQEKASQNINLFGGSAVSQVADIAQESRSICDTLYATYQTLVRMLDSQCRPLLDQNPDYTAVRAVRDLIKWLNDESEIQNNFTASLNAYNLGDIAAVRYIPSMENKMIQTFWETSYQSLPGVADAERREQDEAARQRQEQAAARKARYEEGQKDAHSQKAQKEASYQDALIRWREAVAQTERNRADRIARMSESERTALTTAATEEYAAASIHLEQEKQLLQATLTRAQADLSAQGFFQFGEKLRLKKEIEKLQAQLSEKENALQNAAAQRDRKIRDIPFRLRQKQNEWEKVAEKAYPMPQEPCPPGMTPQQFASKKLQDAIYETLSQHKMLTVTELMEKCAAVRDLSETRVKALLRQMLGDRVEYREAARRAYYAAIPEKTDKQKVQDQEDRKRAKEAIYAYVRSAGRCTVGDISNNCIDIMHLPIQTVSALTRQLYEEGRLHRTESDRKAYFEIV